MDSSRQVCKVDRYQKNSDLPLITCIMISGKPLHLPGALRPLCMQHWQLKIKWSLVFETLERWLLFILIIVAEALLICRHQGSGCCFSCTAKFHRNRFSCSKCQGRSFHLSPLSPFPAGQSTHVGHWQWAWLLSKWSYAQKETGEGNGTPLEYSCLENPMDGGAGRLQSVGSLGVGHNWAT